MKSLFDPLFILYGGAWIMIHVYRFIGDPLPWLNGWLTDFVFIPVAAHTALTFTRHFSDKGSSYRYPLRFLILAWIYVSVVCEWLMPLISSRAVADLNDVFAYLGGSLFYYYVHQRISFTSL